MNSAVSSLDFPLAATSINPTSCGVGGGALLTVLGSGFSSTTSVKIDGLECAIVLANYSTISCLSPQNVSVLFMANWFKRFKTYFFLN